MAYRLAFLPEISGVHNVFHMSMLKKYVLDSSHVLRHELLEIQEDVTYVEKPVRVIDTKEQELRTRTREGSVCVEKTRLTQYGPHDQIKRAGKRVVFNVGHFFEFPYNIYVCVFVCGKFQIRSYVFILFQKKDTSFKTSQISP